MKLVVFPAADYAACLTRRLSLKQEELTPANVATDACPALLPLCSLMEGVTRMLYAHNHAVVSAVPGALRT